MADNEIQNEETAEDLLEADAIEIETEVEEVEFSQNQTEDEVTALMEQEGLIADAEDEQNEVFIEEDRLKSLLESILFSSPKPMTFDAIKSVFKGTNVTSKQLRRVLEDYATDLASFDRGVYIEEIAGGYQLRTKIENADFLKNVVKQKPFRISGPSMEVLAIIAYKQPCIKAEVDTIRGVESGHLIRVLMDKGLLQFDGKSDLPGKPMLYKTTKKFLEVFGLRNIRELPSLEEIDQLIPEGIGGEEEDNKTLDILTGELSLDYGARDAEAEEEFEKITGRLSEISTSSEYFEKEKERVRLQKEKDKADDVRERIIMGQSVEEREINWLKKYEDRLIALEATGEEAQPAEQGQAQEAQADASTDAEPSTAEDGAEELQASAQAEVEAKTDSGAEEAPVVEVSEQKVSTLASAALDAFAAFDDADEAKNKIDA